MRFNTYVTLQMPGLTEDRLWALADALIDQESPIVMDSTVAATLTTGEVEVEHYVDAHSGPAALSLALDVIHRALSGIDALVVESRVASQEPVAA